MNKLFAQILSLVLLACVLAEHVSPFFTDAQASITVTNAEDVKGKEIEKQKEKLFGTQIFDPAEPGDQSVYTPAQIHFKYLAYLSLPEIPPDKA